MVIYSAQTTNKSKTLSDTAIAEHMSGTSIRVAACLLLVSRGQGVDQLAKRSEDDSISWVFGVSKKNVTKGQHLPIV